MESFDFARMAGWVWCPVSRWSGSGSSALSAWIRHWMAAGFRGLFSRRSVRAELVENAFRNAAESTVIRPGAIWHRGSQYTAASFRALVKDLDMRSSMGRAGVCWDGRRRGVLLLGTEERERIHRTVFAQAKRDVIRYIEDFSNNWRRHSALDCVRPNEVHTVSSSRPRQRRESG